MHPAIDECRGTIFKTFSGIGGKNKYRAQQNSNPKLNMEQKIKYTYAIMVCHFMGC